MSKEIIDATDIKWSESSGIFKLEAIILEDGRMFQQRGRAWFDITNEGNEFKIDLQFEITK